MFILRDLLHPLQAQFSTTAQGQKRKLWFAYTLLAVVVPFTSSITSNLLRTLHTLFGLTLQSQRFYSFMASSTLPWKRLWRTMWHMIPALWLRPFSRSCSTDKSELVSMVTVHCGNRVVETNTLTMGLVAP